MNKARENESPNRVILFMIYRDTTQLSRVMHGEEYFPAQVYHASIPCLFPNHCIFYDFFIVSINHRNLKVTSAMPNSSGTYLSFVLYHELHLSLAIMYEEGEL